MTKNKYHGNNYVIFVFLISKILFQKNYKNNFKNKKNIVKYKIIKFLIKLSKNYLKNLNNNY